MLWSSIFFTKSINNYYLLWALTRRNYIANNLKNSHVEVCFCALRNTPVELFKVPFKRSTCIHLSISISSVTHVNVTGVTHAAATCVTNTTVTYVTCISYHCLVERLRAGTSYHPP